MEIFIIMGHGWHGSLFMFHVSPRFEIGRDGERRVNLWYYILLDLSRDSTYVSQISSCHKSLYHMPYAEGLDAVDDDNKPSNV
eukprot:scaffold74487_cov56-Cyclotella_meneghiniana.AAC.1